MTMTNNFNLENIDGATVYDQNNDKVGDVKEVYLDDQTGEPRFITVATGLFGMKETFVPLEAANRIADGDLKVPYTKDFIKDAPNVDPDGHIEPSEERQIFEYYSLDFGADRTAAPTRDTEGIAGAPAADTQGVAAGQDVGEQAVAHEEHLVVGKEERVVGQARLRKRVVTERQQVEVPVEREELVVEREQIDESSPAARAGTIDDTGEVEETITLHEERPVVGKETVATEKVNVGKRKVVDTETVEGDVRKEEIDVETDGDTDRRGTTR
ncbi:DUF2382 domain-containing protein [Enteractinococcus coprophilus]|uniref:Uncharacterized protein (TIGR02271 family) n=1 Tax=Enteractinococcus coprophilus TaxID=1027633 RepID=A0A543AGA3_9MICC|nr:PRC and DUF2382 domain-containing protein [Enteractinococcus coprophilus]TQL71546.1 uncharacterized protein (TIGR02271 family) [Enteractinococcus coprophilus]